MEGPRLYVQRARGNLDWRGIEALAKCYETHFGIPSDAGQINEKGLKIICEGYLIGFTQAWKP